jgi:hypothetical protein
LTSLKFFVADEEDRRRAHKRGGGAVVPLEFPSGEERTNGSQHTMKRQSGSSSGAGRFRCSTESWRNCGTSSCITAARSISSG